MGIPNLTKFIDKNCNFNWKHARRLTNLSHLVVDGCQASFFLYEESRWCLGGEYCEYGDRVKNFFEKLRERFEIENLTVVMDGDGIAPKKKKEGRVYGVETTEERVSKKLMYAVFMDILRQLDWVTIFVAEGEADHVIACLANHYQCPVLSDDSDFLIFNLKHGYIQLQHCDKKEVKVYDISYFMNLYNLRKYELCLLIPSFRGNDFIPHSTKKDCKSLKDFLEKISKCDSVEEFFAKHENNELEKRYDTAREFYCNLQMPRWTCDKIKLLPRWIFFKFRQGLFAGYLLKVYFSSFHYLPEIVEDAERESAWRISRRIRRFLLGFMGLSSGESVTEKIREECQIVKPIHLKRTITCDDFPLTCERVSGDVKTLKQIVLIGMQCYAMQEILDRLFSNAGEDKWKLPVVVTLYWYREQRRYLKLCQCDLLLKSLLLSFLVCSGVIKKNDIPSFKEVYKASINNPAHWITLHAFAEWQCVYHDARALNQAAREPFPTNSLAYLYSGHMAMYYATVASHEGDWVNDILVRGSDKWVLFNKLLLLITECGMYYSRVQKSPRRH